MRQAVSSRAALFRPLRVRLNSHRSRSRGLKGVSQKARTQTTCRTSFRPKRNRKRAPRTNPDSSQCLTLQPITIRKPRSLPPKAITPPAPSSPIITNPLLTIRRVVQQTRRCSVHKSRQRIREGPSHLLLKVSGSRVPAGRLPIASIVRCLEMSP